MSITLGIPLLFWTDVIKKTSNNYVFFPFKSLSLSWVNLWQPVLSHWAFSNFQWQRILKNIIFKSNSTTKPVSTNGGRSAIFASKSSGEPPRNSTSVYYLRLRNFLFLSSFACLVSQVTLGKNLSWSHSLICIQDISLPLWKWNLSVGVLRVLLLFFSCLAIVWFEICKPM